MSERRLVLVHAHPDDECIGTGGVMARYADEGAHVCLITCTNGEAGEIASEAGDPEALRPILGEVRGRELQAACRILGVEDVRMLGYHDSGMEGTPENEAAHAFVNQPFDEVVARVAAVFRDVRPHAVVTYNEKGFYGHPDHIRAHDATVAAIQAAADVWQVPKLYFNAFPKSRMRLAHELFGEEARFDEEGIERVGTDDELITTAVDVSAYVRRKFDALAEHRTQRGTTQWFFNIPQEVRAVAMGTEFYVLARSTLPTPEGIEQDLFEGV
jgi:N-acetyl-1-D-myo-inositol-2-amino-2-deoxy-alpha-D-glucopyranoside deacetylase